jgi:hypothetical protein
MKFDSSCYGKNKFGHNRMLERVFGLAGQELTRKDRKLLLNHLRHEFLLTCQNGVQIENELQILQSLEVDSTNDLTVKSVTLENNQPTVQPYLKIKFPLYRKYTYSALPF